MNRKQASIFARGVLAALALSAVFAASASAGPAWRFNGEELNGNLANVETKVVSANSTLPIDYRLHFVDGQWKVYDMVIDQVSIVHNYRAQFDRVIARSSVKELLQKMKEPAS